VWSGHIGTSSTLLDFSSWVNPGRSTCPSTAFLLAHRLRFFFDWVSLLSVRGSPASGSRPALPPPEVVELGLTVTGAHLIWLESVGSNGPPHSEAAQAVTTSCTSVCSLRFFKRLRFGMNFCGCWVWILAGSQSRFCLESLDQKTQGFMVQIAPPR
jgi:hypothetical protein